MKTLPSGITAALAGQRSTLATLWKVTRKDGQIFGFTDHDQPLTVGGITYEAASGFMRTAIKGTADLAVDNLDLAGVLDSSAITEADLLAGKWDHAEVEILIVNWEQPSGGTDQRRRGWIGEVSLTESGFSAEIRGLAQKLAKPVTRIISPGCDADLGDTRCGLNLATYTVTGTVTTTASASAFNDSGRAEADNFFRFGKVTWTGGANNGLGMEVKTYTQTGGAFVLMEAMPYAIAPGDTYSVYRGCDKQLATCRDTFSNVARFRGFPHVPGADQVLTIGTPL